MNAKTITLNAKQKKFVEEYLKTFNATRAAKEAGYSEKTAAEQGYRLLKHVQIQELINSELDMIHDKQKKVLIRAADEAIDALLKTIRDGRGLARVQAANSILDRAGHKPTDHVQAKINASVIGTMDIKDARLELAEKFDRNFPITRGAPHENLELKPSSGESST